MGVFTSKQRMENQASTAAKRHAKTLRKGMTDAERRLWSRLRKEQLGVKFRRQHPLGGYVLDFACLDPKLVIEIDGSQHLDQRAYDAHRTDWLMNQGFAVLRFWANVVMSETDAVVVRIIEQLSLVARAAPTPTLPQRGREFTQGEQP
jgi:very-short-patch-repair endonuclease